MPTERVVGEPRSVGALSWTGVHRDGVLLVPVGSTEQHGPHLPLSTDTDIAGAVCEGVAGLDPRCVVAPPIPYGASGEHQDFAGTLSIGHEALELLLVELGRSATTTWPTVVLVNGHGGNRPALERAGSRLRFEGRDVRTWTATWRGDAHAGRIETSLMLHLRPTAVRSYEGVQGNPARLAELLPAMVAGGVAAVSPSGVLGDPTGASAAEGATVLQQLVASCLEVVLDAPTERGAVPPQTVGSA